MVNRVFQWIKGEYEGQFERVVRVEGDWVVFESDTPMQPRRVYASELNTFLKEVMVPGMEANYMPAESLGMSVEQRFPEFSQPAAPPPPPTEETILDSILGKQKQMDRIPLEFFAEVAVPTREVYGFMLSMYDEADVNMALLKKVRASLEAELRAQLADDGQLSRRIGEWYKTKVKDGKNEPSKSAEARV